ncbi:hypothetical protein IAD21_00509 [Abditibacteriota bacterium]|nr:hypothetical protein IAD21_00509 [Abditibacteriota bacterium]
MIGERIKQYRLARGMSLEDLAIAMGDIVSRQALHKYEKGDAKPSPAVLTRLGTALQIPPASLWHQPEVKVGLVAYRKHSRMTKTHQEQAESLVNVALEERLRLQELLQRELEQQDPSDIPVHRFTVTSLDEAEAAADDLRQKWDLGADALCNLTTILEDHSIHVIEIDVDEKFDGLSAIARKEGEVVSAAVISRRGVPGDRQRFNMAHELGHIVMEVAPGVDEERAAHRFAGAFLAPAKLLWREVGKKRTSIGMGELKILKSKIGLSVQALLMRLRDLKIIEEEHYKMWCITLNKAGLRSQEIGESLAPERSQWLEMATLKALAEGLISSREAKGLIGDQVASRDIPDSLAQWRAFIGLPAQQRQKLVEEQAQRAATMPDQTDWNEWESAEAPLPA